ncbi:MAG: SPW repeat protein [Methylobacteriaceae bacterium]|nr:SPW repeat protein [Rhodoblastus sp.]MCC0004148.1 SPW repeat protein [Methylobacteriaceae bacterium]
MAAVSRSASNRLDYFTLLMGIALVASPWLFGYSGKEPAVASSIVAGLAIIGCAVVALADLPHLFEEVDVVLGVLTAAAPWIIGFSTIPHATIAHVVLGLGVALLSLGELWWERTHKTAGV